MVAYLQDRDIDWARSAMVGDRPTDLQFAENLNIRGFQLRTPQFGGDWDWDGIAHTLADAPRRAVVQRHTKETNIRVEIDLDGAPQARITTGLPFFNHMLEQIAKHAGISLQIQRCWGSAYRRTSHDRRYRLGARSGSAPSLGG